MFDAKGENGLMKPAQAPPLASIGFPVTMFPRLAKSCLPLRMSARPGTIAEQYAETTRQEGWTRASRLTLDDLNLRIKARVKQPNLVVKGDVQGSAEALRQSLEKQARPR